MGSQLGNRRIPQIQSSRHPFCQIV